MGLRTVDAGSVTRRSWYYL